MRKHNFVHLRTGKLIGFKAEIILTLDRLKYDDKKKKIAERIMPSLLGYMDEEDIEHFKLLYEYKE